MSNTLTTKRITTVNDPHFDFAWGLYNSAFPAEERRELDYQTEALAKEEYHFEVILKDDEPIGLMGWWGLSDFRYIEHLATSDEVRGKGYGADIVSQFIQRDTQPVILEVEHPLSEINRRRILFYKRLGFKLNDHPYCQPSLRQIEGEWVDLLLMSHPYAISFDELHHFVDHSHPVIHFRNFAK